MRLTVRCRHERRRRCTGDDVVHRRGCGLAHGSGGAWPEFPVERFGEFFCHLPLNPRARQCPSLTVGGSYLEKHKCPVVVSFGGMDGGECLYCVAQRPAMVDRGGGLKRLAGGIRGDAGHLRLTGAGVRPGQEGERGGFALPVVDAPVGVQRITGGYDGFL